MDKKIFRLPALSAATLLAAVAVAPAQAAYVCTGVSGNAAGNPYFNGDMTDSVCDTDEVLGALGLPNTPTDVANFESLIVGSKIDSVGDPIVSWTETQNGLGTLTVTTSTDTTGTWSLTGGGITPLLYVEKYDSGYDVYTYMGAGSDPFGDSWDGVNRGTAGALCEAEVGSINCKATTSHVSVYGVVPIPAAVWLFGSGLLGLVGIARRRRS